MTSEFSGLIGRTRSYWETTKEYAQTNPKRIATITALALVIIGAGVGGGIAASKHHSPALPNNATPTPATFRPITSAPHSPQPTAPFTPLPTTLAPATSTPITPAPSTPTPITPTPATLTPATPAPPNTPAGFREALNATITEAVDGDPITPVINELTLLNPLVNSNDRQTIYDAALIQIATARATDILNAVSEQTYLNLAFNPQTELTLAEIFNNPPAKKSQANQRRQVHSQGPLAKAYQRYKPKENHTPYFGKGRFPHR